MMRTSSGATPRLGDPQLQALIGASGLTGELDAAAFVEVATKLWDSWADDAMLADKQAGVHADAAKVRPINHRGRFLRVDGPLNVPCSPQGYPLLVQAGSSEDGRQFAARFTEAVFTAQQTLGEAQDFYRDLKRRTAALGRDPDDIRILPGIVPVIGDTAEEARNSTPSSKD
jgi:alkanesulfonate monooxygenase SsuD/methylene tetrahydromethanopterin reductase-like flavin-dependent oxidoreductase (luciferase family)